MFVLYRTVTVPPQFSCSVCFSQCNCDGTGTQRRTQTQCTQCQPYSMHPNRGAEGKRFPEQSVQHKTPGKLQRKSPQHIHSQVVHPAATGMLSAPRALLVKLTFHCTASQSMVQGGRGTSRHSSVLEACIEGFSLPLRVVAIVRRNDRCSSDRLLQHPHLLMRCTPKA